jgi:hypothetical protein
MAFIMPTVAENLSSFWLTDNALHALKRETNLCPDYFVLMYTAKK